MKQVIYFISVLLLLSFLFSSNNSNENDVFPSHPEVTLDDIKEGTLLSEAETEGYYNIIPNLHTNVHIDVSGMVSSATVDQVFTNDSTEPIEAVYVFPLPPNATGSGVCRRDHVLWRNVHCRPPNLAGRPCALPAETFAGERKRAVLRILRRICKSI